MAKASFRTVVIGDSVAWGQGLLEEQKFSSIVLQQLTARARTEGWPDGTVSPPKVFAHSGAVISSDPAKPADEQLRIQHINDRFHGELPLSYPSIMDQVDRILEGDRVDLVMMTAGANDLNLFKVVDVSVPEAVFVQRIEELFHHKLALLLAKVGRKCDGASIALCGYYKPISEESHSPLLDPLLDQLAGSNPSGLNGLARLREISARGDLWMQTSVTCMKRAIADAVAAEPSLEARIYLAVPRWDDSNAVFAPMTKIWGLGPLLQAQDTFSQLRNDEYLKFHTVYNPNRPPDWKDIQFSRRASAGHPNPAGAQRFAQAILQHADAIWGRFQARQGNA